MKLTLRGISQSQSFIWLCLSAALVVLFIQPRATSSSVPASITPTSKPQPDNLSPFFAEPQLPPLGEPYLYLPSEELDAKSNLQNTHLVIKLKQRRVYVYQDNHVKTSYPIAVGKAGWETPLGTYKVITMQRDPAWQHPWNGTIIPPGPDNPLGKRWIGFWTDGRNYIGFHGTPDEQLVGQAVSHGCIRMRNQDILALYGIVQIGTPVTVEP